MKLMGKTALVTGAARRIGKQIALSLAEEGMNIIVHFSTSLDEAEQTAAEIRGKAVKAWPVQADFADTAALSGFMERCAKAAGTVGVLVNSASIYPPGTLLCAGDGQFIENMKINALAPLQLCRLFARQCPEGSIINILDARMDDYDPKHVPYSLSKQAFKSLTKMLSLELAPEMRVNAVAPGLILPPVGGSDEYLEKHAHTNPLNRWGTARDIADAVIYLLKARFVTGQTIYVDGGRHIRGYLDE
jgi:NAD(P)-dependent dehydrogenase (short-subunit alcohol dehydrogenase family)